MQNVYTFYGVKSKSEEVQASKRRVVKIFAGRKMIDMFLAEPEGEIVKFKKEVTND